ncbi:hypothetical protein, partial [Novosphingobium sp. fls2-241-R2A-195]|uniref:hypothetical protein n=1 Tax=Novosphingobium sp. fls2-241-R2A-195 TaxID=3040296 RepID=UPI0025502FE0
AVATAVITRSEGMLQPLMNSEMELLSAPTLNRSREPHGLTAIYGNATPGNSGILEEALAHRL